MQNKSTGCTAGRNEYLSDELNVTDSNIVSVSDDYEAIMLTAAVIRLSSYSTNATRCHSYKPHTGVNK